MHKWHLQMPEIQHAYVATVTVAALAVGICNTYKYLSLMETIYLINAALCNDKLVNQFAACSGSPHDDKSSHW